LLAAFGAGSGAGSFIRARYIRTQKGFRTLTRPSIYLLYAVGNRKKCSFLAGGKRRNALRCLHSRTI